MQTAAHDDDQINRFWLQIYRSEKNPENRAHDRSFVFDGEYDNRCTEPAYALFPTDYSRVIKKTNLTCYEQSI